MSCSLMIITQINVRFYWLSFESLFDKFKFVLVLRILWICFHVTYILLIVVFKLETNCVIILPLLSKALIKTFIECCLIFIFFLLIHLIKVLVHQKVFRTKLKLFQFSCLKRFWQSSLMTKSTMACGFFKGINILLVWWILILWGAFLKIFMA